MSKQAPFIRKIIGDQTLNTNILTMDIETVNINGTLIPYLICWYDGHTVRSYWNQDFKNFDHLVSSMMGDLCIRKYRDHKIYLHNFSSFDGIFLLKALTKIGNCSPIINDGKLISLLFKFKLSKKDNFTLQFRDSFLLLPSSLKKLGKSFNTEITKDLFPIKFKDINYIGEVPNITYFNDISTNEYNNYVNSFTIWSFKDESIKYCIKDCISLFQVLIKFNELVFEKFNLNINKYTTLPSLSMAIFRSEYIYDDSKIGILLGDTEKEIRKSYTGGAVDMFIPINEKGYKSLWL